jgi:hypothetical protein
VPEDNTNITVTNAINDDYDQVADARSVSSESDLAESPAGQTIRSSYTSPIFDTNRNPLEPCPVNGCPLNPQSRVAFSSSIIKYFHRFAI